MLLVPAALGLDAVQGVQAAEAVEHGPQRRVLAALDRVGERLEHDEVDPRAGGREDVVLAVDEHRERVAAGVDAALEAPRRAREDVLRAPAEQVELGRAARRSRAVVAAGEQAVGEAGEQAAHGRALGDDPDRLAGEELRQRRAGRARRRRRGSR